MNNAKRNLIIAAIVVEFISIIVNLTWVIFAIASPKIVISVAGAVYDFITIAGQIAVAVLLTISIWGWGKHFSTRRGFYTAALIVSVCLDTFSLATLLLIISLFTSDIVWVKPIDDVYFGQEEEKAEKIDEKTEVIRDDDKEKKIKELRDKLDKGEITEAEFKEELFKLL